MSDRGPIKGAGEWLVHRLTDNYWFATLVGTLLAPCLAGALLMADHHGASDWIVQHGLTPVASAGTAQQFVTTVVGVGAAIVTLYLSATLIVLTLAAGALGVRLVEYWLGKHSIRFSLTLFVFSLVYALIVLAAIDDQAAVADLPLLSLIVMGALQLIVVVTLAFALQDLGRTSLVDESIGRLGVQAGQIALPLRSAPPVETAWRYTLYASRAGYIEGVDLEEIGEHLPGEHCRAQVTVPPGAYVLAGEPLLLLDQEPRDPEKFRNCFVIGRCRSSEQATVFEIRLLVEIALRAMSPAVNDLYTARACADWLAFALDGHHENWVEDGSRALYAEDQRIELPGQDLAGLFAAPLHAFRQSAAAYPPIATRMIGHYARLAGRAEAASLDAFYRREARDLAEHAASLAGFPGDRETILAAFARFDTSAAARSPE